MNEREILEDFRRKYEATYVFVRQPDTGEEDLMFVESIVPDDVKVGVINMTSEEIGRITINFGSAHTLLFKPAPTGVFQFGKSAYVCTREPRRQWRRGVCADNTTMVAVGNGITPQPSKWCYDLVAAAYAKEVHMIATALELLAAKRCRSVALKGGFAITQPMVVEHAQYLLFYYQIPVAAINKEGRIERVFESAFEQQVNQILSS